MADIWTQIRMEREALRDLLSTLTDEQWQTESLCERWSIHDLVAHIVDSNERQMGPMALGLLRCGLSIDRYNQHKVDRIGAVSNKTLAARYAATVDLQMKLPIPTQFVLAEQLVHNQDAFMALGRKRVVPIETVLIVAHLYRSFGFARQWKKRYPYIRLIASDANWSYGLGDEARGPLLSIVMAIAGRTTAYRDLEGPGSERLQRKTFVS
jgi:uncharacterized protein (TIGR03083 family)